MKANHACGNALVDLELSDTFLVADSCVDLKIGCVVKKKLALLGVIICSIKIDLQKIVLLFSIKCDTLGLNFMKLLFSA